MPNPLLENSQAPQPAGQQEMPAQEEPKQQFTMDEVTDLIHKQAAIDGALREVLRTPGPIDRKKVLDAAAKLVAKRVISAQAAAGYLIDLPKDPNLVRNWCERHAADAEGHLSQMLDKIQGVDIPTPQDALNQVLRNGRG